MGTVLGETDVKQVIVMYCLSRTVSYRCSFFLLHCTAQLK